jgi:hypothetical protein
MIRQRKMLNFKVSSSFFNKFSFVGFFPDMMIIMNAEANKEYWIWSFTIVCRCMPESVKKPLAKLEAIVDTIVSFAFDKLASTQN